MLLACPLVEISIYSTCKRISQKILRNVQKFALMIADSDYGTLNFRVLRENMEEINLQGPLGHTDTRVINSYPSKVRILPFKRLCANFAIQTSVCEFCHSNVKVYFIGMRDKSQLVRHAHQLFCRQAQDQRRICVLCELVHDLSQAGMHHAHERLVVCTLKAKFSDIVVHSLEQPVQVSVGSAHVVHLLLHEHAGLHVDKRPAQVDLEELPALCVQVFAQRGSGVRVTLGSCHQSVRAEPSGLRVQNSHGRGLHEDPNLRVAPTFAVGSDPHPIRRSSRSF